MSDTESNLNKNTPAQSGDVLPHGLSVVLTVIFTGIILSLSVLFGISAWLGEGETVDGYYDGEEHPGIILAPFSDAFYKSAELRELIVRYDYRLYGKLTTGSVIKGKNGFLFDMGSTDGYSYIGDYLGQTPPDEGEIAALARGITALRGRFADAGIYCLVAVIPNTQTVYSEYMPDYFNDISENTRLRCLDRYLENVGGEGYTDLCGALLAAKDKGQLYNNTENSLNALGAYYVYRAVLDALPEKYTSALTPPDIDGIGIHSHYTEGKELARRAGISGLIRNRTLSLTSDFKRLYTAGGSIRDIRMTYAMTEYAQSMPVEPAVLFAFSGEWDRILLTDYFSNTFGVAGYLTGISGTGGTLTDALDRVLGRELSGAGQDDGEGLPRFSAAVVFIHEYELGLFSDYGSNG